VAAVDDVGDGSGPARIRVIPGRLAVMALGAVALAGALVGGLVRLGWGLAPAASLVAFHGPLMVTGFLGTLIGLERAIALGRRWAYAAPVASGLGALALMVGAPGGAWLMMLGSLVMVLAFVAILRRQAALFTAIMALGAVCWWIGQMLWLAGEPVHRVVAWWAGFFVLTIVGERLELTRLLRPGPAPRAIVVLAVTVLVGGLAAAPCAPEVGVRVVGAAMIALALWLGLFDIARRTVRTSGLPRFIAVALLAGYAWLGVAGLLAVRWGPVAAGSSYDAMLHALFVGFVFSMIFGHAPIIVVAVLGRRLMYRPRFYIHLAVLHASLVLRIVGDLAPWLPGRRWGGLLNALAIVLFLASTATAMFQPVRPTDLGSGAPGPRVSKEAP
jgi:hypothetical protein